jgi:hypothetical protein
MSPSLLLTRAEAAALLGLGVGTVDYFRRSGKLETVRLPRLGDRIFVTRTSVEGLIRERESEENDIRARRQAAAESLA